MKIPLSVVSTDLLKSWNFNLVLEIWNLYEILAKKVLLVQSMFCKFLIGLYDATVQDTCGEPNSKAMNEWVYNSVRINPFAP